MARPVPAPYLSLLGPQPDSLPSWVVGAQGAMPLPPPVGVVLQHLVCTPSPPSAPHSKKPGEDAAVEWGTWAALSNLTMAGVQKENSPSRRARRYWCQMSEESKVCHIKHVAVEKPVSRRT